MTTSTLIISQIATSTGEMIESIFPLFWWIAGAAFALLITSVIIKSILKGIKIIKGRN